jgi:hypothetical protein
MNRIHAFLISSVLGCLALCLPAAAQVAGGTISGTVTNVAGAEVPGASVTITDAATGLVRTVVSDKDGFYSVPNLNPGNYIITVTMEGFKSLSASALLTVGSEALVNGRLQPGDSKTVVQEGEAADVQAASSATSSEVRGQSVRELPLNGRDWTQLATTNAGVSSLDTQSNPALGSNARGNRGWGAALKIGGTRPQANLFRLDGITINDYSGGSPGGVLGLSLGADAVQEFTVISGNASAAYGRVSGAVINAVVRAGTNKFHGSAEEFLRNSDFDARNFYDGSSVPPFRRNQFGASLGGPVGKSNTFFFFNYEGLRQSLSSTTVDTVPSVAAHSGQLVAGAVTINPKVLPYLALYPLPNAGQNGDYGTYTFVAKNVVPENLYTARVDHEFSEKDSLHGSFQSDGSTSTGPDFYNFVVQELLSSRKFVSLEETHSFNGKLVNSAGVGVARTVSISPGESGAINPLAVDSSLGFVPGANVGVITISGITTFSGGVNAEAQYTYHYTSYQAHDDLFYTRGEHALRFGGAVEYIQANDFGSTTLGNFTFGSLKSFLLNQPTNFTSAVPGASSPIDMRQKVAGGYVLDDWRAKPNLTLNLGMRYEIASVLSERKNRLSNLPSLTSAQPRLGSPFFQNPTLRDFEPRVGFAWSPFSNGKTVVRGGFGIYDVLPLTNMFNLTVLNTAPFFETGNVTSGLAGTFPAGAYPLITPQVLKYAYVQDNPSRIYVMQWNFAIQRVLGQGFVAQVSYNGMHGVHLPFRTNDANIVMPTVGSNGLLTWPIPVGSGTRLNPNAGTIDGTLFETSSKYNALNLGISRQMKGLRLGASYTWAKSLDDSSSSGNNYTNSLLAEFVYYPQLFRGLSDFDVGHVFSLNYLWELPGPRSPGVVRSIVGGWQLGGIFRASDGLPFTPVIGGDPMGLKDNNVFGLPDRLIGPGCSSGVNPGNPTHYINTACFAFPQPANRLGDSGRNILIGPGVANLDFSLYKNIPLRKLSERSNLQFRAELFNVPNHPSFKTPDRTVAQIFNVSGASLVNGGYLNGTSTTSRQIQLVLRLTF